MCRCRRPVSPGLWEAGTVVARVLQGEEPGRGGTGGVRGWGDVYSGGREEGLTTDIMMSVS